MSVHFVAVLALCDCWSRRALLAHPESSVKQSVHNPLCPVYSLYEQLTDIPGQEETQ